MTILVAVKKKGRIFIGADRITTFGNEYFTDLVNGSKIIKLKHAYLATSGYTLLDNVIEHLHETNHKMMDNQFKDRAQVFSFFLELYAELKKNYTLVDTGKDTYAAIYNVFMVVTPKALYGVSNNLSVHEYERFAAQGAGSDYSLGCLYGVYDTIDDGFELVRLALEAACHFSVYCKEPLDIVEVRASDFGKRSTRGYKAHGRSLRTMTKRKSAGNLAAVALRTRKTGERSRSAKSTDSGASTKSSQGARKSAAVRSYRGAGGRAVAKRTKKTRRR